MNSAGKAQNTLLTPCTSTALTMAVPSRTGTRSMPTKPTRLRVAAPLKWRSTTGAPG